MAQGNKQRVTLQDLIASRGSGKPALTLDAIIAGQTQRKAQAAAAAKSAYTAKPAPALATTRPATPVAAEPRPENPNYRALDKDDMAAIDFAANLLSVPVGWIVEFYRDFKPAKEPVKVVVLHTNPDTEALFIAWLVTQPDVWGKFYGVAPGARVVFIPSGPLDPKSPLWVGIRPENLNAAYLEDHGYLFVDCGGGGGRLDQHGRPENTIGASISSLDMLVAANPKMFVTNDFLLPLFEVISRNDKFAEVLAKDPPSARKRSKTPRTARHIRSVLDGLNQAAADDRTLSWNQVAEFVFLAFDAAEDFLMEKAMECMTRTVGEDGRERDVLDLKKLRDRRFEALLLETIVGHMPKPRADKEIAASMPKATKPEVDAVRVAERKRATLVARFPEVAQQALERLEREWVQAENDFRDSKKVQEIADAAFMKRDDSRAASDRLVPSRNYLYIVGGISESGRFGAYTRFLANAREQKRVKEYLIALARKEHQKQSGAPALAEQAGPTAEGVSMMAVPVSLSADGTIECAMVAEGTEVAPPTSRKSEPPPEVSPEEVEDAELDGLEDEASGDGIERKGDYAGLPESVASVLKAAVRTVRASVVTVQIRSPLSKQENGPITNCKFGVATTFIDLRDVVETVRAEQVKVWGMKAEDEDLARASHLVLIDGKGNRFRLDYLPEWGTYWGNWFKTNQTLPFGRLSAEQVLYLVTLGMGRSDGRVRELAERQGQKLAEPEWVRIVREGLPGLLPE